MVVTRGGAGPPPPAISPLIPTITPAGETSGQDDLQLLLTFKAPELFHFKTEPSIQRHKTAVSVRFGLAKKAAVSVPVSITVTTLVVCISRSDWLD